MQLREKYTRLVRELARFGDTVGLRDTLKQMRAREIPIPLPTIHVFLFHFARINHRNDFFTLFKEELAKSPEKKQENEKGSPTPAAALYNAAFSCSVETGHLDWAQQLLQDMEKDGLEWDEPTYLIAARMKVAKGEGVAEIMDKARANKLKSTHLYTYALLHVSDADKATLEAEMHHMGLTKTEKRMPLLYWVKPTAPPFLDYKTLVSMNVQPSKKTSKQKLALPNGKSTTTPSTPTELPAAQIPPPSTPSASTVPSEAPTQTPPPPPPVPTPITNAQFTPSLGSAPYTSAPEILALDTSAPTPVPNIVLHHNPQTLDQYHAILLKIPEINHRRLVLDHMVKIGMLPNTTTLDILASFFKDMHSKELLTVRLWKSFKRAPPADLQQELARRMVPNVPFPPTAVLDFYKAHGISAVALYQEVLLKTAMPGKLHELKDTFAHMMRNNMPVDKGLIATVLARLLVGEAGEFNDLHYWLQASGVILDPTVYTMLAFQVAATPTLASIAKRDIILQLHRLLRQQRITPDAEFFGVAMRCIIACADATPCAPLLLAMKDAGVRLDHSLNALVVVFLLRCGEIALAEQLDEEVRQTASEIQLAYYHGYLSACHDRGELSNLKPNSIIHASAATLHFTTPSSAQTPNTSISTNLAPPATVPYPLPKQNVINQNRKGERSARTNSNSSLAANPTSQPQPKATSTPTREGNTHTNRANNSNPNKKNNPTPNNNKRKNQNRNPNQDNSNAKDLTAQSKSNPPS